MDVYLCSFADSRMNQTLKRVKKEAEEFACFRKIFVYNESVLDSEFTMTFQSYLKKGTRGYGYWVWKPYLILKILNMINDGDVLIYMDAGNHLNINGKGKINDYISTLYQSKSGILVIKGNDNLLEKYYTKGDLLDFFKVRDNKLVTETPQLGANPIFIKKSDHTIALIKKWMNVFYYDFSLVDDTMSKSSNLAGFIEHRHDQSVLSLLLKLDGGCLCLNEEDIYNDDWNLMKDFPIWAIRDKKISFLCRIRRFIGKVIPSLKVYS